MGVMVFISSTVVAYLNLFNSLIGFITTYLFPKAALKQWFTLRMPKDPAFAEYMMTFCGQRDAAWAILTVIELFFPMRLVATTFSPASSTVHSLLATFSSESSTSVRHTAWPRG